MIFAREASDSLTSLVKKIDAATVENKDKSMCSFVTFLTDEEGAADKLKKVAEKAGLKKLVFAVDNVAGPKDYKIAKDADVTVVLYNKRTVEANHTFRKGELNTAAVEKVVGDLKKILK
ncbi:MAG: hypothetical protein HY040_08470 [Planctomycetes bacterium]|nr:hypothetical protein [Planctomycetota bacterium]